MPFEITQASKEDAPALSEVFFAAFSDDVNRRMFPPAPDTRAWMIENAFGGKDPAKDSEIFLKITDPSQPDMPVAVAKWIRPLSAAERRESEADPRPAWPVSSDPEICDWFFGMMDEHHHRLMANRPHYCKLPIVLFLHEGGWVVLYMLGVLSASFRMNVHEVVN